MNLYEKYDRYCDKKSQGLKSEARQLAEQLIAEYAQSPDYEFVLSVCDQPYGKINHLIWESIVLPELECRIESDPRAIRAFIKTSGNFSSSKESRGRLKHVTMRNLIDTLLRLDPADVWAKDKKIDGLTSWLNFVIHEWPSGLLYGMNGATLSECDEIIDAAEELRTLDNSAHIISFCDDVKSKAVEYKQRLSSQAKDKELESGDK